MYSHLKRRDSIDRGRSSFFLLLPSYLVTSENSTHKAVAYYVSGGTMLPKRPLYFILDLTPDRAGVIRFPGTREEPQGIASLSWPP